MHQYYVYILANPSRALYVGVANNLERRMYEHRNKLIAGFPSRYNITMLVHMEEYGHIHDAIACEKEIKGWRRVKKIGLIEAENPRWTGLSHSWFAE